MKKITLELPDWAFESEITIHSWLELVAIIKEDGETWVKTGRCNMCGECCRGLGEGYKQKEMLDNNGDCKYLKDNKCTLDIWKPFACIMNFHDDPKLKPKRCSEEFVKVKNAFKK